MCTAVPINAEMIKSHRFEFLNLSIWFEIAEVDKESFDAVESLWFEEVKQTEEFFHVVL